jgi:hypothetical protein
VNESCFSFDLHQRLRVAVDFSLLQLKKERHRAGRGSPPAIVQSEPANGHRDFFQGDGFQVLVVFQVLLVVRMGTVACLDNGAYLTTPCRSIAPSPVQLRSGRRKYGQTSPICVAAPPTFGSRLPISLHDPIDPCDVRV